MTRDAPAAAGPPRDLGARRYAPWVVIWLVVVAACAGQWFIYDASRGHAWPFRYYLWWSAYMWAVLTPTAAWVASRLPIRRTNLHRALPVHVAVSIALMVIQLSVESLIGWRHHANLLAAAALRHYFSQHAQIYLTTYWVIVAAVVYLRTREEAAAAMVRSAALKAELADARMEALRRQLQPHFLFNTLQAAIELVHVDPDGAEEVLVGLSELLRAVLEEIRSDEITLERELELLHDYIRIQERRFQDRVRFEVRVDAELRGCTVPPLLLQPLVENAVRHGVGEHRDRDIITVSACRRADMLDLSVTNHTGMLAPHDSATWGVGLGVTRDRLDQLYGAGRWSVELESLGPTGVRASVSLPFRRSGEAERVITAAGR